MKQPTARVLFVLLAATFSAEAVLEAQTGAELPPNVPSAAYLRSTVRFLSSDELQGRRAGTPGGRLAELYVSSQFDALGLEGGGANGSFEQELSLVSVAPEVTMVVGGQGQTLTVGPDDPEFLAWPTKPQSAVTTDGELVFVGFGTRAPEYEWDDFGDAPLTGRVLVALAGDPGLLDSTRFRGRAGTVYGTVGRKVQEAARRGAKGVIIVHDAALVGAPWEATRAEWGGNVLLGRDGGAGAALDFVAWVTADRLSEMIGSFGRDFSVLRARAQLPTFSPIPLGAHAVVRLRSVKEDVHPRGILGTVRGGEPGMADRVVVVTAHLDHLGTAAGYGIDSVFNGARDNAAGVTVLLGAAAALRAMPSTPKRSVLFVALTATEGTFPGPASLLQQVPLPAERIAAVINLERPDMRNDPPVVSHVDAAASGLLGPLEVAAQHEGVQLIPSRGVQPGQSDLAHVAFAERGVPGLTLFGGPGPDDTQETYISDRFHQPDDELDPDAGFDGLRSQARLVARLARMVADATDEAAWDRGSPYRGAWERLERRRTQRP